MDVECIRFTVRSLISSFKNPTFKTYHRTYLAPSKTNIIGLFTNIQGGSEKYYYSSLKDNTQVAIVIEKIIGEMRDLWTFKTLKKGNRGKGIIRRSRNFKPIYTIYVKNDKKVIDDNILTYLMKPQRIPSLGMDDEIIHIQDVKIVKLDVVKSDTFDSVIPFQPNDDSFINFTINADLLEHSTVIYPVDNYVCSDFDVKWKSNGRSTRKPAKHLYVKEFYKCSVKLRKKIDAFYDPEKETTILFY